MQTKEALDWYNPIASVGVTVITTTSFLVVGDIWVVVASMRVVGDIAVVVVSVLSSFSVNKHVQF